jgi:hypothetical protein
LTGVAKRREQGKVDDESDRGGRAELHPTAQQPPLGAMVRTSLNSHHPPSQVP